MIELMLSGFFFWFVIVTNIASNRFGYQTFSDLDAEAQLQKINADPKFDGDAIYGAFRLRRYHQHRRHFQRQLQL